jgi:AcrR family transcriptional regulator
VADRHSVPATGVDTEDGVREGRAERSRTTRERVLAVALAQLDAGGEAAVRVDLISTESGVSIGSIYHHFGDREGVIAAAQLRRFSANTEAGMDAFLDAVEGNTTAAGFRAALLEATTAGDDAERHAGRWQLLTVLASTVGRAELEGEITELQTRLNDRLESWVVDQQSRGIVRSDVAPRAVIAMLWSWKLGFAMNDLDGNGVAAEGWHDLVATTIDMLLTTG